MSATRGTLPQKRSLKRSAEDETVGETMGELRRKYGFWGSVGSLRLRDLWTVEFFVAPLLGAAVAGWLVARGSKGARISLAGDYLELSGALLGVVFAGFALVIAFLSDAYLRELNGTTEGVVAFLRPFMIATGLQVAVLACVVVYRGLAPEIPTIVEKVGFVVLTMLFMAALFDVVALARSVMLHGIARASRAGKDAGSSVRPIDEPRRRSN